MIHQLVCKILKQNTLYYSLQRNDKHVHHIIVNKCNVWTKNIARIYSLIDLIWTKLNHTHDNYYGSYGAQKTRAYEILY